MTIKLLEHQELAINQLKTGSILCGGVGTGKSITALGYYYLKECGGSIDSKGRPIPGPTYKDLYVITTAKKRDSLDWERECNRFGIRGTVDSWNNIGKYVKIENAFFVFDEQRVIGSGSWVKSFRKIAKKNNWILLSATPGDSWMDYIPVFIANGFYKTRTEFIEEHVIYKNFRKFRQVDRYLGTDKLARLQDQITVYMSYEKSTVKHTKTIVVLYDKEKYELAQKARWNPYKDRPIREISELCFTLRRIVNSDIRRLNVVKELLPRHQKVIIFYNFNYELEVLRTLSSIPDVEVAEYNGHRHDPIPTSSTWAYLVNYKSGAEGWNCIETNTIIFYSRDYSYRVTAQAAGRIDRLNTPFVNLYYYFLTSLSSIDMAIAKALKSKEDFNESKFLKGVE